MPELNRKTLHRDRCVLCHHLHDQAVACPPTGVWLFAWSLRVNQPIVVVLTERRRTA
jgi:hypothetical protein